MDCKFASTGQQEENWCDIHLCSIIVMSSQILIHLKQWVSGLIWSRRNTVENYNVTGVLIKNLGQKTDELWVNYVEVLLFATK